MAHDLDLPSQASLNHRFGLIAPAVNADLHLVRRGWTLSGNVLVELGATRFLVRFDAGRIAEITSSIPLFQDRLFTIRASTVAWHALWQRMPQAGWHDIFALTKRKEMAIEGSMQPFFAHLQYIKEVLEMPRTMAPSDSGHGV